MASGRTISSAGTAGVRVHRGQERDRGRGPVPLADITTTGGVAPEPTARAPAVDPTAEARRRGDTRTTGRRRCCPHLKPKHRADELKLQGRHGHKRKKSRSRSRSASKPRDRDRGSSDVAAKKHKHERGGSGGGGHHRDRRDRSPLLRPRP
ncbi:hypothetical protein SKAU_G00080310 [Synaphobranchus kaupii]|uniref:Uncharacterized protein n=1 Tax=Synaphobranchus kaupii TaxID=118154 RepID=A0A9Q1FUI9_SYNKA|nr:hypothetical protein SKAU_G00080310 [Synaphobranchus kaupii]